MLPSYSCCYPAEPKLEKRTRIKNKGNCSLQTRIYFFFQFYDFMVVLFVIFSALPSPCRIDSFVGDGDRPSPVAVVLIDGLVLE